MKSTFGDLPETIRASSIFETTHPNVDILKEILIRAWDKKLKLPSFWIEENDIYIHTSYGAWCICENGSLLEVLWIDWKEVFSFNKEIGIQKLLDELQKL